MDKEFIPKTRGGKDRMTTFLNLISEIEESITAKRRADLEAMSQEEKINNHYTAILPEIPKTKKGIDKAIEEFIKEMHPEKDNGEGLLEYLGFYDIGEDIEEGDHTIRANYLRERINFKEEGDTITILSSTKEVVDVVKEYLQSLPPEELYNLQVFGIVVTEKTANWHRVNYIEQAKYHYNYQLFFYVFEKLKLIPTDTEEDVLLRAAKLEHNALKDFYKDINKNRTEEDIINDYKEAIIKAITKYPEETTAYYRAIKMLRTNYSDKAILSTISEILRNGTTTD